MGPQDGQASQAYSVAYGRLIKALGCQVTQAVNQVADKRVTCLVRCGPANGFFTVHRVTRPDYVTHHQLLGTGLRNKRDQNAQTGMARYVFVLAPVLNRDNLVAVWPRTFSA